MPGKIVYSNIPGFDVHDCHNQVLRDARGLRWCEIAALWRAIPGFRSPRPGLRLFHHSVHVNRGSLCRVSRAINQMDEFTIISP